MTHDASLISISDISGPPVTLMITPRAPLTDAPSSSGLELARRAISSPLLEGASVNGSRGVIINVTGGPDLSLFEVSEASSIIQEAADEDANIIFGAVVDPALVGKVKITVIATGFGAQASARPVSSTAQTPADMTRYADHARLRHDAVPAPASIPVPRFSIARRPLIDLPMAVNSGESSMDPSAATSASDPDLLRQSGEAQTPATDPDFDLSSTFDVPAFLRRQEG